MPTREKRTFSVSQLNTVELARTLSHGEKTHFSRNEKRTINSFTCPLVFLLTCQLTTLCQLFRKKFNIMSALFTNQSPTLPQKIDSREGLF